MKPSKNLVDLLTLDQLLSNSKCMWQGAESPGTGFEPQTPGFQGMRAKGISPWPGRMLYWSIGTDSQMPHVDAHHSLRDRRAKLSTQFALACLHGHAAQIPNPSYAYFHLQSALYHSCRLLPSFVLAMSKLDSSLASGASETYKLNYFSSLS